MRVMTRKAGKAALLPGLLTAVILGLGVQPERKEISGTFTARYTNHQSADVADSPGHMLLLTQSQGSNRDTGPTSYMDDAEVTSSEIADLVQGTGTHRGYTQFSGDGSTITVRWSGDVTTTLAGDNRPRTSFRGTWEYVSGTGAYEGVEGNGKYEGSLTSQTEYTLAWTGFYSK